MGAGEKLPTTPSRVWTPPRGTRNTPDNSCNGTNGPHDRGDSDKGEIWDPVEELGLVEVVTRKITCLGKTWDNKRCRYGPSANNNRPCMLYESGMIREHVQRLSKLSIAEVATRRADLLLDLAEASMCLKEADEDSEWQGHASEQAAAQAYTWRRHLTLKANLIRVPRVLRPEAYAVESNEGKRRRHDDDDDEDNNNGTQPSPSPANKRQAGTTAEESIFLSQPPTTASPDSMRDPRAYSPGSTPSAKRFTGKRVRSMPMLPPERLAHGVRTLERRLQEKDAIIRDIELELRDARLAAIEAQTV